METLEIEDTIDLEIKTSKGRRVFTVIEMTKGMKDRLEKAEKKLNDSDDLDYRMDNITKLIIMLAPGSKKKDLEDYSYRGLRQIYYRMLQVSLGVKIDDEKIQEPVRRGVKIDDEKKIQEPVRRKYSRSKKRGSVSKK